MGRRLRVLTAAVVLLIVGVAAASGAWGAKPKKRPTVIRLYVPAPGHVTLEVAKLHITGKNVATFKLPNRFHLINGAAFPGAEVMVAAKVKRGKAAETVTVVAVVVNNGTGPSRSLSSAGAGRAAVSGVEATPTDLLVGDGQDPTWEVEFGQAALKSGFASETIRGRIFGLAYKAGFAAGNDGLSPDTEAAYLRALDDIFAAPDKWDPTRTPPNSTDPGVETGHYDDGHAFGWKKGNVTGVVDGLKIATTPQDQSPDLIRAIYAEAGIVQPLFRYGFSGLSTTIDPGVIGISPFTETFSGTACAASPVNTTWTLSIAFGSAQPQTIPGVALPTGSPTAIVTNTARDNGVEVGQAVSTLAVVGATVPGGVDMELNVETTGTEHVTSTVPDDGLITAAQLPAGATC